MKNPKMQYKVVLVYDGKEITEKELIELLKKIKW